MHWRRPGTNQSNCGPPKRVGGGNDGNVPPAPARGPTPLAAPLRLTRSHLATYRDGIVVALRLIFDTIVAGLNRPELYKPSLLIFTNFLSDCLDWFFVWGGGVGTLRRWPALIFASIFTSKTSTSPTDWAATNSVTSKSPTRQSDLGNELVWQ